MCLQLNVYENVNDIRRLVSCDNGPTDLRQLQNCYRTGRKALPQGTRREQIALIRL